MPLPAFMLTARRRDRYANFDPDARTYLLEVEAADGQQLEPEVGTAINAFVLALKADDLWGKIESMCIFAGPRTLAGATVTMKGPAVTLAGSPTPSQAFQHTRRGGLRGDGTSAYIDTNYGHANSAGLPTNDRHLATWVTQQFSDNTNQTFIGVGGYEAAASNGFSHIGHRYGDRSDTSLALSTNDPPGTDSGTVYFNGVSGVPGSDRPLNFHGVSRSNSSEFKYRLVGTDYTATKASSTPAAGDIFVHARNDGDGTASFHTLHRLYFYSIGKSVNLASLEGKVADLKSALDAFLP